MLLTDAEYLRAAYRLARNSHDLSTQNGAILVDPSTGEVVASGWNDLPPQIRQLGERRLRPAKYLWTEHAERAALYDAASRGIRTSGLWLFCPWLACADCGRALVMSGISRVVGHDLGLHHTRGDWADSIRTADTMFAEAGVRVTRLDAPLGVRFRFDGQEIDA
jgi:dCMP deaminase